MSDDASPLGSKVVIRPAAPEDMELLAGMVRELAIYEKMEEHAKATAEDFRRHLFGPRPSAEAAIAELEDEPIGFALWFISFSTFRGQPGIYLEDLFVRPRYRGRGVGKAILSMLARLAVERDYGRLEWSVLNWNEPAIGFYRTIGANPNDEWTVYRLADGPLRRLALSETIEKDTNG